MTLISKKTQYIVSELINVSLQDVSHGFFSRHGGVSADPFDSLNFDGRDGDSLKNIAQNRAIAASACGCPIENIVTVNQMHGKGVLCLDDETLLTYDKPVDADAIITDRPNLPVGILTADCMPILLFDPVKKAAGAVHAGWKGTVKGVAAATVEAMAASFGSRPEDLRAAIGPHIRECCLRVKEDVRAEFSKTFGPVNNIFRENADGLRLDLRAANLSQLLGAGLKSYHIEIIAPCTSCHNDLFYSYRKEGGRTGRQLSYIMLR